MDMTIPDIINLISVLTMLAAVAAVWRINPLERWRPHEYLFGILFIVLAGLRFIAGIIIHPDEGRYVFSSLENFITILVIAAGVIILHRSHHNNEAHRRQMVREQELRLANLVDHLPDVFIRFGRNMQFVLVNSAVEKEFGVKPEYFSGKSLLEIDLPQDNLEHLHEIIASVLETGCPRIDEVSLHRRSGVQHYLTYGFPELSESDRVETALFILRNITDKVQASQAIHASEERFRRVVRANPMGMHFYRIEADGRLALVDYNNSAEAILRVSHAELVGKSIEEAFPGLVETEVPSAYRRLALDGGTWHKEQVNYDAGTISGAYEVDAFQIAPMNMVATFTDITGRKRQEEALLLSEERMKLAVQTAGLGIWEMDLATGKTHWQSDLYPFFGCHPEELGQNATEFFNERVLPEDMKNIYEIYDRAQQKSLAETAPHEKYLMVDTPYTFRARRADNTEITLLGSMAFRRGPRGEFERVVGTLIDITRQKQAEEVIQQQVEELELQRAVDQAIIATNDVQSCVEMLIRPIRQFFCADMVEVLLYNQEHERIQYIAGEGYVSNAVLLSFPVTQGTPWLAISSRQPVHLENIPQNPQLSNNQFYKEEKIVSCYTVPLLTPDRVQGVLQVFFRSQTRLEATKETFLSTVAGQLAIAVEKSLLWDSLQQTLCDLKQSYETSLETLVHALDLRDNETEHHTRRVTELSVAIAQMLGVPDELVDNIRRGALLHDVGKIGIPDSILHKAGPLDEAEWLVMRQHPVKAYQLLKKIELFHDALDIAYCHHERWDGSGYPRGLKGEEIPLAARIFAVADVWDALTSDRPYRKRWTDEQAAAHIAAHAGVLFDPIVTEIFLSLVKKVE